jgi:hypothetical protein
MIVRDIGIEGSSFTEKSWQGAIAINLRSNLDDTRRI